MGFSDDLDQHRAALQREAEQLREAQRAEEEAAVAAKALFIQRFQDAVALLQAEGAEELRIVDVQKGMRGYAQLRRVYPGKATEIDGFFLHDGKLSTGYTEFCGVRSFTHGLRKNQRVINTAGRDVKRWVGRAPADGYLSSGIQPGQLCIITHYESNSYVDAYEWLLHATAAALKRLEDARL